MFSAACGQDSGPLQAKRIRYPGNGDNSGSDWSTGPHQEPRGTGRRGRLRPPGGRHPSRLRPDPRLVDPAHPRPPRAGRRARGRGLRRRDRAGRASPSSRAARARRTSSRRSPTPTWTPSRSSSSPARSPPASIGTDAFQEVDTTGVTMGVTKHNYLVKDVAEIPQRRRRGLPHRDHRTARAGADRLPEGHRQHEGRVGGGGGGRPAGVLAAGGCPTPEAIARVGRAHPGRPSAPCSTSGAASSRPRRAGALAALVEATGIPVVTTLMARGAFPDSDPRCLGMPGMHGSYAAVTAIQRSDLLISLGRALRRPGDGQGLGLRAGGQGHPRRHRPRRDRQGAPAGRRRRRRLPAGDRGARRGAAAKANRSIAARLAPVAGADRGVAGAVPATPTTPGRRDDQAAVRRRAAA